MPRYRNSGVDFDQSVGADGQVELPVTGSIDRQGLAKEISEIEVQTDVNSLGSKADLLAFFEEPVEIYLDEGTGPNDEPVVQVSVNDKSVWLKRGQNHTIARKFVANLATARPDSFKTVEATDRDGAKTVRLQKHTGIRYPFSVINDTKRGIEWLRQIRGGASR